MLVASTSAVAIPFARRGRGPMQVNIKVIDGPHKGREFAFEEHVNFIVGRATFALVRLPEKDRFFSRVYFMVEVNPPQCRLMDMKSTNGTIVNGRRVTTAGLFYGVLLGRDRPLVE